MNIFISDVQLSDISPDRDTVASTLSETLEGLPVFDAGDLSENAWPSEYERYANYFPYSFPVPGNHDQYHIESYPYPLEQNITKDGIRVVGVNSSYRYNTEKMTALANLLADKVETIVYMHLPMYSSNTRVGASAIYNRALYLPMFEKGNVPLVISGHGHAFEHHIADGRNYVVIGTSGAPLDTVASSKTLIKAISNHGYFTVRKLDSYLDCNFKDVLGNTGYTFKAGISSVDLPSPDIAIEEQPM